MKRTYLSGMFQVILCLLYVLVPLIILLIDYHTVWDERWIYYLVFAVFCGLWRHSGYVLLANFLLLVLLPQLWDIFGDPNVEHNEDYSSFVILVQRAPFVIYFVAKVALLQSLAVILRNIGFRSVFRNRVPWGANE